MLSSEFQRSSNENHQSCCWPGLHVYDISSFGKEHLFTVTPEIKMTHCSYFITSTMKKHITFQKTLDRIIVTPSKKKQTWQIRRNHEIENNTQYDLDENATDGEDMNDEEELPAEIFFIQRLGNNDTINNEDTYCIHTELSCFDMCLCLIRLVCCITEIM